MERYYDRVIGLTLYHGLF